VTVSASTEFRPIDGQLLGWADGMTITLSSSTTVWAGFCVARSSSGERYRRQSLEGVR